MLNYSEKKVFFAVKSKCLKNGACLVSPEEIISLANDRYLDEKSLSRILKAIAYEGYFELIYTERNGKPLYCITLREKGIEYDREVKNFRRWLMVKLAITVGLAFVSFITGLILKRIF